MPSWRAGSAASAGCSILAAVALGRVQVNEDRSTRTRRTLGAGTLARAPGEPRRPHDGRQSAVADSDFRLATPAAGRLANQGVRVEITQGGEVVDIGRLNTKNVTTGSDGRGRGHLHGAHRAAVAELGPGFTVTIYRHAGGYRLS